MAEIGLIASIAGVTAIAVALSKTLYEAIQDTANAPESVRALDKEIRITCLMLNGLLQSLRDGAEDRPEMPEIIDQLRQDLGRLSEIVKRHLPVKGNAAQQVWNQFVWMTKTREVARLRASIKSYRTLLSESVIVNSSTQLAALQRNLAIGQQDRLYSEVVRPHYESRMSRHEYRTLDISPETRPRVISNDDIELMTERPINLLSMQSDYRTTDLPDKKSKAFLRRAITKVTTDRFAM